MEVRLVNFIDEITITDIDIDWVEGILDGDIRFDQSRRNIIKNLESIDIQAFPGSGKTTILVAKLAILAKKWTAATSGICVLSHTNVAREEIEKRLGDTEIGAKLLRYPHFIGTVHSFFNSFVGLPWIRSKGNPIEIVDTDFVCANRWKSLPVQFHKTLLNRRKTYMDLCFKNELGKIDLGNLGENTLTYKTIKTIVKNSQEKGYFTFGETLLFAQEAVSNNPQIVGYIQKRFPLLFIDEAQDTNSFQWDLINSTFPASIQQGFGDENQAIYNYVGENETDSFPRNNPLVLPESKRFNSNISKIANPLAISNAEMIGMSTTFDCKNTIFLFATDKIDKVLEEYSKLVLLTFTDEELKKYQADGCHAIGMVHTKKEETVPDQLPKGVFDYWHNYNHKSISRKTAPDYLVEYFILGRNELDLTGEAHLQVEWVLKGLKILINKVADTIVIENKTSLVNSFLSKLDNEKQNIFREKLLLILNKTSFIETEWVEMQNVISSILSLFNLEIGTSDFMEWSNNIDIATSYDSGGLCPKNVFRYSDESNRSVDVTLGSIHSVKGQTHLSTLVLETFSYNHNINSILPFISGAPPKKKPGVRDRGRLKCHYVAMTRARGLLCLAIPKDKVDENSISNLELLGWNIRVIE
ncbi:ATP-dependent helicase [Listeria monocytogenes]|nr:ATP-dependent helicase [Listeria monocytogenes]EAF6701443.1 ATP-dependent helicase [Listeria monocytogenes]EAG6686413.1 ATP-dependent helicase [Listeria monocytogenes]